MNTCPSICPYLSLRPSDPTYSSKQFQKKCKFKFVSDFPQPPPTRYLCTKDWRYNSTFYSLSPQIEVSIFSTPPFYFPGKESLYVRLTCACSPHVFCDINRPCQVTRSTVSLIAKHYICLQSVIYITVKFRSCWKRSRIYFPG